MQPVLPLEDMTVEEKLTALDQIWRDLLKTPGDVFSPNWHKDVLEARSQRIKTGESKFVDWKYAKRKLLAGFKKI